MAPVHEKHPRLSKHKVTWTLDSEKGNESALGAEGKQGQRATAGACRPKAAGARLGRPWGAALPRGSSTWRQPPTVTLVTILITFSHSGVRTTFSR